MLTPLEVEQEYQRDLAAINLEAGFLFKLGLFIGPVALASVLLLGVSPFVAAVIFSLLVVSATALLNPHSYNRFFLFTFPVAWCIAGWSSAAALCLYTYSILFTGATLLALVTTDVKYHLNHYRIRRSLGSSRDVRLLEE